MPMTRPRMVLYNHLRDKKDSGMFHRLSSTVPTNCFCGRSAVVVQLVERQISNLNVCEFESRLPLQLRTFNSDGQSNCLLSSKSDGFKSPKVRHICAISSDGRAHDFCWGNSSGRRPRRKCLVVASSSLALSTKSCGPGFKSLMAHQYLVVQ